MSQKFASFRRVVGVHRITTASGLFYNKMVKYFFKALFCVDLSIIPKISGQEVEICKALYN